VLLLRFPVLELAEIHDPADRGLGHRRDLDQIELGCIRLGDRFRQGDDSELLAVDTDQAYFRGVDFAVDPLLLFQGYCRFSSC
jgi:hypothetical protein